MTPEEFSTVLAAALEENLAAAISDVTGNTQLGVEEAITYERAGVLSHEPGVVIVLTDGSEYRMTAYPVR
ncbi:hypothetical protein ACWFMI_23745 [Nocardiopsis terrae]|uniref:hypothetical protein n=1 Tax=Streptomyces sp. NPDC057554 TaxID=3350538 RepID=UPI003679331D